ncbi:MAG: YdiY family protein [Candidatus Brocadia sp.]
MDRTFPDEIKTIDGDIITGEVVGVDEEYLSIRQGQDHISFLQWRIISLISRDKEVIIVNHDETQKKFSILKTANSLSAKDIHLATTDKISDIYPKEKIARRPLFEQGVKQSVQTGAAAPTVTDMKKPGQTEQPGTSPGISETKVSSVEGPSTPSKTWKGNIGAGINIKDGNTESTSTNVKGEYTNERKRDNIYFNALALYEVVTNKDTDVDEETINEQRATAKYEYKHTLRLYSFFNQYFEHDEIENLNYRLISSPGMGYRFILKDALKYKAEGGPAYARERFQRGTLEETLGIRVGQYFDWKFLPTTAFYAKAEYVQSAQDRADWRLDSGMGIKHNLTKSLTLNLELLDQYDNTPAEGKEKEDRSVIGSVGYNF